MSAEKVLRQVAELEELLAYSTQGEWIENGTLVGPGLYECDASTTEDEPESWITFKTPRPDTDRKVWILLRQNAQALFELKRAAVEWACDEARGEEFQRKQDRLIELALVELEGMD